MRVVVLGGAGHMGGYAVAALARLPFIEQLVVADRDGEGARRRAEEVGAVAARVDVTDGDQLATVLADADAVVSTVGPFFRFGTEILDAALAAGCHYVDICDDPGPTLELLERDVVARAAGLSAIVGAGASPGISNLLAVKAVDGLDAIDTLITGWGTGGRPDDPDDHHPEGATAAVEHWVEQLTGPIPIHDGGQRVQGAPLKPVPVRLPGRAPVTAYTVGHPEPVTLPCTYPAVRRSLNVMDMPAAVMVLVGAAVQAVGSGRLTVAEASEQLTRGLYGGKAGPGARVAARALAAHVREKVLGKEYLPQIYALAIGTRGGRRETRAAYLDGAIPGGMGGATCIPAAVTLTMLAEGEITRRGVFAPEGGVDPDRFFGRLQPHVVRDPGSEGDGPVRLLVEQ